MEGAASTSAFSPAARATPPPEAPAASAPSKRALDESSSTSTGSGSADEESGDTRIELNVGGVAFSTRLSVLAAAPESMLGTMFAERNVGAFKSKKALSFETRDPAVFAEVLRYCRSGDLELVHPPAGVSQRKWLDDLDFWGIMPPLPLGVHPDISDEFRRCVELVAEAIRATKPPLLDRLRAGFLKMARFVTPTYGPQPAEETASLRNYLSMWLMGDPAASVETALAAAAAHWSAWTSSETYARSIIRGAERFLHVGAAAAAAAAAAATDSAAGGGSSEGLSSAQQSSAAAAAASSSSGGGSNLAELMMAPGAAAVHAAATAALIYSAATLMTHGDLAQHYLRRELARDSLSCAFASTVWPEDLGAGELEASGWPNPYEDIPEHGAAAVILKLWAAKLRGSPVPAAEPAVWKASIALEERRRLGEVGLKAKKGVTYLLIDVTGLR